MYTDSLVRTTVAMTNQAALCLKIDKMEEKLQQPRLYVRVVRLIWTINISYMVWISKLKQFNYTIGEIIIHEGSWYEPPAINICKFDFKILWKKSAIHSWCQIMTPHKISRVHSILLIGYKTYNSMLNGHKDKNMLVLSFCAFVFENCECCS